MTNDLQTFLTTGVFTFLLTFVRVGTIIMIMPGISNTYVPSQVRLYFSLALTLVLSSLVQKYMPASVPPMPTLFFMIIVELLIGVFIGTIARILVAALDTAGLIVSMQSSLSNAQLFNPAFASQGSIIGSFITLTGILLIFTTDLYQFLVIGILRSYDIFPLGVMPDIAGLNKSIIDAIASSFMVGIQITAPFFIVIMMLYVAMGMMSKMMPAMQVFMVAMPVQIMLALSLLALVGAAMMMVWLQHYEQGMALFTFVGDHKRGG